MPGMNGPAVLSALKERMQTARIPVVLMTARLQTREIDLFRSLGAAGVLPKPFDPMTLAGTVRSYLNRTDFGLGAVRNVFLQRVRDETALLKRCRAMLSDESAQSVLLIKVRDFAHGLAGAGVSFVTRARTCRVRAPMPQRESAGELLTAYAYLSPIYIIGTARNDSSSARHDEFPRTFASEAIRPCRLIDQGECNEVGTVG